MAGQIGVNSIYLVPGQTVKIKAGTGYNNHNGFYARRSTVPASYFPKRIAAGQNDPVTLLQGFAVEDENVGTLGPHPEESLSVVYTHNKPYTNAVWFFAEEGQTSILNVISVPIHDHSTIIHGGPAYGTYFDDDVER